MKNRNVHPRTIKIIALMSAALFLSACAATQVALEHKDLETETKMSQTIFLDPVPKIQRTVYVDLRNTSDQQLTITPGIKAAIRSHGYHLVSNPNEAHYLLQGNILRVAKMSASAANKVLGAGYGADISGTLIGSAVGAYSNGIDGALAGGLIGAAATTVANSLVKDVNYVMITDLQISERVAEGNDIIESTRSTLQNGTSSTSVQTSKTKTAYKRYRTRIVSSADKVNLKFAQAKSNLEHGLISAISGIF